MNSEEYLASLVRLAADAEALAEDSLYLDAPFDDPSARSRAALVLLRCCRDELAARGIHQIPPAPPRNLPLVDMDDLICYTLTDTERSPT